MFSWLHIWWLERQLAHPSSAQRRRTISLLARYRSSKVDELLRRATQDSNPEVVLSVLETLSVRMRGCENVPGYLYGLLMHPTPSIRQAVKQMIGSQYPDYSVVTASIAAFDSISERLINSLPDSNEAFLAIDALWWLNSDRAAGLLFDYLPRTCSSLQHYIFSIIGPLQRFRGTAAATTLLEQCLENSAESFAAPNIAASTKLICELADDIFYQALVRRLWSTDPAYRDSLVHVLDKLHADWRNSDVFHTAFSNAYHEILATYNNTSYTASFTDNQNRLEMFIESVIALITSLNLSTAVNLLQLAKTLRQPRIWAKIEQLVLPRVHISSCDLCRELQLSDALPNGVRESLILFVEPETNDHEYEACLGTILDNPHESPAVRTAALHALGRRGFVLAPESIDSLLSEQDENLLATKLIAIANAELSHSSQCLKAVLVRSLENERSFISRLCVQLLIPRADAEILSFLESRVTRQVVADYLWMALPEDSTKDCGAYRFATTTLSSLALGKARHNERASLTNYQIIERLHEVSSDSNDLNTIAVTEWAKSMLQEREQPLSEFLVKYYYLGYKRRRNVASLTADDLAKCWGVGRYWHQ